MNNKKKVLVILSPGFPKDEADSSCLTERQLFVKALKSAYPSLHIIVLAFQYPFIYTTYCWHNIEVHSFAGSNRQKINRLLLWVRVWQRLRSINKKYKIVGLLSFWLGECAFVGSLFSKRYAIKHYCWILGQDAKGNNKYVSLIKPKPDELIALSDFLADEFFKNYLIRPKHIIPVGVDICLFPPLNAQRPIDILGAGSLIPLKRYDWFIEAVQPVVKFFPNLKIVICGKGPEAQKLLQLINKLQLQRNIILMGEVPHNVLLQLMQEAKIFLHTSSYEGFGAVIAEALYAGAYVISCTKPLEQNIAQLYIAINREEITNKLLYILKNKQTVYQRVLVCSIHKTVEDTMQLFAG